MEAKKILLVEDNPDDVILTERVLKKNNINNELQVEKDGAAALDYLFGTGSNAGHDARPLPSVVILDLNLPKISGLEVLREIRSHDQTQNMPVVILSSSKEEQDVADSYRLGADIYIRKPLDVGKFAEVIQQFGLRGPELSGHLPERRDLK